MTQSRKRSKALGGDFLPGGTPHPRRGEHFHELALALLKAFPVGTVFSSERFDTWTAIQLDMDIPAYDTIAWKGHVLRRHETIRQINKASTHPRMWESEAETYELVCIKPELYEVRLINMQKIGALQAAHTISFLNHCCRETERYLQGIKWDALPPQAIGAAKHLLYAWEYFIENIDHQMNITRRLSNDVHGYQQTNDAPPSPLLPPGATESDDLELFFEEK